MLYNKAKGATTTGPYQHNVSMFKQILPRRRPCNPQDNTTRSQSRFLPFQILIICILHMCILSFYQHVRSNKWFPFACRTEPQLIEKHCLVRRIFIATFLSAKCIGGRAMLLLSLPKTPQLNQHFPYMKDLWKYWWWVGSCAAQLQRNGQTWRQGKGWPQSRVK